MKRTVLLPAACLLDAIAGDPEWFPHPVRLIGFAISTGEILLRRPDRSARFNLLAGAGMTIWLTGGTYLLTILAVRQSKSRSTHLGKAVELLLAWTCLAARNLRDEATAVTDALQAEDLPRARLRLARVVGRETAHLDAAEISRAVIETVAESASDGVIAPMFYLALGGAPLAMAYKAVNTLDSMIGHADSTYFYFGKCAARLDDLANFIPARLTALAIVASAWLTGCDAAWSLRTWVRDGGKHKSPNAGQPESAMSGALRVRLGGCNVYAGEVLCTPEMGASFPTAQAAHAKKSIGILAASTMLCLAAGILMNLRRDTRWTR